ncbi:MAG: GDP-mannose 4,6-dehydratase [Thermoplasmatales archaeon]
MKKKVLITGITGQDGAFLAKQLIDKGFEVFGTYRRVSSPNFWRLAYLGIENSIHLVPCDILDATSVFRVIKSIKPEYIYNLAAQSQVLASFDSPIITSEITGISVTNFLEGILRLDKSIKFYNAATSEMYGNLGNSGSFNEESPMKPSSPYAVSKLYAYWMVKVYRESYGLFAVNGILFNHESEIRGLEFVTRKISNEVAKIKLGLSDRIVLGNIESYRDWGYAPDYTNAMQMMMQSEQPDDFVVASGETHQVKEFLRLAFEYVNLDYNNYLEFSPKFRRPTDVNYLRGSHDKITRLLGWKPRVSFKKLVKLMVDADLERWKNIKAGRIVPTDALFYDENRFDIYSMEGVL